MAVIDDSVIIIRNALFEDREAIRRIRKDKIYGGVDYLYHSYYILLQDPDTWHGVAEYNGDIIGYCLFKVTF